MLHESELIAFIENYPDSNIGRDDFFEEKSWNSIRLSFFFAVWLLISFLVLFIFFVKRRQTPLSNSKSVKITKNVIDFENRN